MRGLRVFVRVNDDNDGNGFWHMFNGAQQNAAQSVGQFELKKKNV